MARKRRRFTAEFKVRVALEALRERDSVQAIAEVRGRVPPRAPRRAGRRTHHRLVDRFLQRGPSAFVSGRADAGRCLPQRHGGTANAATPHVPDRALVSRGRRGATQDLTIPGPSLQRRPSPGRRSGSPPGDRGSYWRLSFPCRAKIGGWTIHPERTQSESSRGLFSQPLGIHLNIALGLSNEVGPPQSQRLSVIETLQRAGTGQ